MLNDSAEVGRNAGATVWKRDAAGVRSRGEWGNGIAGRIASRVSLRVPAVDALKGRLRIRCLRRAIRSMEGYAGTRQRAKVCRDDGSAEPTWDELPQAIRARSGWVAPR